MVMINWQHGWQQVDSVERKEFFLKELAREIQDNPSHVLSVKGVDVVALNVESDDLLLYRRRSLAMRMCILLGN
jgi:hypothetical protein